MLSSIYVEDEPIIAMDGQAILEDIGFKSICTCYSLPAALAAVKRHGHYDFALLDINLGGGDTSLELAKDLTKRGTRIVFGSGYNPDEKLVEQFDAPIVVKPFDERVLRAVILEVLSGHGAG